MTSVESFRDQDIAVFGLGGSGLSTIRALREGGAHIAAWDDSEQSRDAALSKNVPLVDLSQTDWSAFRALVLAPGVPLTHPTPHWSVKKAQAAGLSVIGDIELFCLERARRAPTAPFIAITGTNGKSTTTSLIAHLLASAQRDIALGGNIGTAVLDLPPPSASLYHVLECSSFQIDLAPSLAPTIGVLLNITPDHLDRHGTMENYAAVKERLVASAETAIIGIDDEWCQAIAKRRQGAGRPLITLSMAENEGSDYLIEGSRISKRTGTGFTPLVDLSSIPTLRGVHNSQNAAAAIAAVSSIGIDLATIQKGLETFPGLAHRLEIIGHIGRAVVINDSKATNADATEKALMSFPDGLFWIAGGRAKEGGIEPLKPLFNRVEKAYLIGEAAQDFSRTLSNHVSFEMSGTMEAALSSALKHAQNSKADEPVILLSPACASYDQFKNFEERGNQFRALVQSQAGFKPRENR
ncbi:MAG: UDP-N-acetylmuramoyl-L-alanine--D-glutamate ligase [Alphaproteobacteria bacterium]